MPYDESLAGRVRRALAETEGVTERKMFGGLCFMLRGNMCLGVEKDRLMVRVGPARYQEALARPHARPMDFTGKPMRGLVFVEPGGTADGPALQEWVRMGVDFAGSLPGK